MTKKITFLTKKNFDKKQIIQKVEEYLGNILDENEQNIIKNILKDFKNDNFSLIDSQEVQFLNLHDYDKWEKSGKMDREEALKILKNWEEKN